MANILFFHRNAISRNAGGISRMTDNLSELFERKGHVVYFLAAEKNEHIRQSINTKQLFLPSLELTCNDNVNCFRQIIEEKKINWIINQDAAFGDVGTLLKMVKERTSVGIITCYHNCILSPVYNYHYQQEFSFKSKGVGFLLPVLQWCPVKDVLIRLYISRNRQQYLDTYYLSDYIVLLSPGQKQEWERMTGLEDKTGKIKIIPNCMRIQPYHEYEKENMVVWVGTIENYIKRPDVLLSIWHKMGDLEGWELVFVGDGNALEFLKAKTKELGLKNVRFAGRVSNPEEYYKRAKVITVTSAHESFSLVTAEAMSYNVVPILFNSFSMAQSLVREEYNGLLVNAFDEIEYAQKLRRLLTDNELLNKMSKTVYQTVKKYDGEVVYSLWDEVL